MLVKNCGTSKTKGEVEHGAIAGYHRTGFSWVSEKLYTEDFLDGEQEGEGTGRE